MTAMRMNCLTLALTLLAATLAVQANDKPLLIEFASRAGALAAVMLVLMYPACRWYRTFEAGHPNSILKYL